MSEELELARRAGQECKALRTLINGNASDLSSLSTDQKTHLVAAINELKSLIDDFEAGSVTWESLTGKPTTFPPSAHNHDGEYDPAGSAGTVAGDLSSHTGNTSNPHSVTKAQVGLSAVENTALSTWTGNTSQSSVGTITTGTWQGTPIGDTYIASASTWNAKAAGTVIADFLGAGTALTSGASITWNCSTQGRQPTLTLAHDAELQIPSNLADGETASISGVQDGTGGRALTYATGYLVMTGNAADVTALAAGDAFEISVKRVGSVYRLFIVTES